MREQLRLLVELQKTEADVNGLKNRNIDLPKLKEALSQEINETEKLFESEKERLETLKKDHRKYETALNDGTENAKKAKGRLLEIKTNREYEATLKEIDSIQDTGSKIEDEIIRILDEIEKATEVLATREGEVAALRNRYELQIREIDEELKTIDAKLDEKVGEQEAIRSKINANLLKKFDLIKKRRNGQAVVSAWQGVCEGCHMNIPPQMYNELLRSEQLLTCPHCNRILYWEDRGIDEL